MFLYPFSWDPWDKPQVHLIWPLEPMVCCPLLKPLFHAPLHNFCPLRNIFLSGAGLHLSLFSHYSSLQTQLMLLDFLWEQINNLMPFFCEHNHNIPKIVTNQINPEHLKISLHFFYFQVLHSINSWVKIRPRECIFQKLQFQCLLDILL